MLDLTIYVNQDKDLNNRKIAAFKNLYKFHKRGNFNEAKAQKIFSPIVKEAAKRHDKASKEYHDDGSEPDVATMAEKKEAEKALVQEFKTEVLQYKNYDWAK